MGCEQSSGETEADDDDKLGHNRSMERVMRKSQGMESNPKSGRKVLAFLWVCEITFFEGRGGSIYILSRPLAAVAAFRMAYPVLCFQQVTG